jgi:hypothetical protein
MVAIAKRREPKLRNGFREPQLRKATRTLNVLRVSDFDPVGRAQIPKLMDEPSLPVPRLAIRESRYFVITQMFGDCVEYLFRTFDWE